MTVNDMKLSAAEEYDEVLMTAPYTDDYGKVWWMARIPFAEKKYYTKMVHPEVCETRTGYEMVDKDFYDYETEESVVKDAYEFIKKKNNNKKIEPMSKEETLEILGNMVAQKMGEMILDGLAKITDRDIEDALLSREFERVSDEIAERHKEK